MLQISQTTLCLALGNSWPKETGLQYGLNADEWLRRSGIFESFFGYLLGSMTTVTAMTYNSMWNLLYPVAIRLADIRGNTFSQKDPKSKQNQKVGKQEQLAYSQSNPKNQ